MSRFTRAFRRAVRIDRYQVCDTRKRDPNGNLLEGFPEGCTVYETLDWMDSEDGVGYGYGDIPASLREELND